MRNTLFHSVPNNKVAACNTDQIDSNKTRNQWFDKRYVGYSKFQLNIY